MAEGLRTGRNGAIIHLYQVALATTVKHEP